MLRLVPRLHVSRRRSGAGDRGRSLIFLLESLRLLYDLRTTAFRFIPGLTAPPVGDGI